MSCAALILSLATAPGALQAPSPSLWAIEGGTLIIPWFTSGNGASFPQARLSRGDTSLTTTSFTIKSTVRTERSWSWPATRTAIAPATEPSTETWLAISLPQKPQGDLQIQGQTIPLVWLTPRTQMPPLHLGPVANDRSEVTDLCSPESAPPLDDPMQAWRWELLAARMNALPPNISRFDGSDLLLASHDVARWREAMWRLYEQSPSVARTAAELLTANVPFGNRTIAAWLTASDAIDELLFMTQQVPASDLAQSALAWCDRQVPVSVWIQGQTQEAVELSILNAAPAPQLAEIIWNRPGALPLALRLPPRTSTQESLETPTLAEREVVVIEVDDHKLLLPADYTVTEVEPPGPILGPLFAPRVLEDVRAASRPTAIAKNYQTYAQLRQLSGHWELMFECRWPAPAMEGPWEQWSLATLPGHEAVIIQVHEGTDKHLLLITPDGNTQTTNSAPSHPASVTTHDYGWLARVRIPEAWTTSGLLSIAIARGHHGIPAVETWPTPGLPWHMNLNAATFDLRRWDQQFSDSNNR